MNRLLLTIAAVGVSFTSGIFVPAMRADGWDKKTSLTVNEPIDVRGLSLAPGKYVFKRLDPGTGSSAVIIYGADEAYPVGMVLAIPASRQDSADKSQFTFSEESAGQPKALRTWFYPGDVEGLEFPVVHKATTAKSAQRNSTNSAQSGE